MDTDKKATLINAAWGGWYARGSDRLKNSFIHHGWNYDINIWKDERINDSFDPKFPYRIKAEALKEAIKMGYTHILWMDCSLWVIKDPNKLMEIIDTEGGLFIKSGYNLAQTSADSDLKWAKTTRDEAQNMPELWSCVFGINLETEHGKRFVKYFLDAYDNGVFDTPRTHSGKSSDERFLHARQDQTAASFAFYKAGYEYMREPWEILSNYNLHDIADKHTIILMRGM